MDAEEKMNVKVNKREAKIRGAKVVMQNKNLATVVRNSIANSQKNKKKIIENNIMEM